MGILYVLIGQLADMHQTAVLETDIDKGAKIDDVQHRTGQFHRGRQVIKL